MLENYMHAWNSEHKNYELNLKKKVQTPLKFSISIQNKNEDKDEIILNVFSNLIIIIKKDNKRSICQF